MKIDKRLNIVVPVEIADGSTVYVHAMPLAREVWERYYRVISRTFAEIYKEGLSFVAGPKVAGLMLKEVAETMGVWQDVQVGLIPEIRRLSNVLIQTPTGWQTIPLEEAAGKKIFDADDAADVDGVLTFFIVNSAVHRREALEVILDGASKLWNARITSSNCTEYAASLPTSTETGSSGERVTQ